MTSPVQLGLQNTFAEQLQGLYVPWAPEGFAQPALIHYNDALHVELGLPSEAKTHAAALFSGSMAPADSVPLCQAYAGHQFGGFSPQLGDGRAVLLGEVATPDGRLMDIQLKGSGRTPFSRGGDGFASVGPILREALLSEAMFHLGVPTTRVLAASRTGEAVYRATPLPGAVLARTASSHIRVGTLQFFAARRDSERLGTLVNFALARHAPHRVGRENPSFELLMHTAEVQAELIAAWMRIGFVHGVMNTDNTTISGETIDYGPCAFLDVYDPKTVFSSIDHGARYAFGNQPGIGQWNLARAGEALLDLLDPDPDTAVERVHQALEHFGTTFATAQLAGARAKLGIPQSASATPDDEAEDEALMADLLAWMHANHSDYTQTFRRLAQSLIQDDPPRGLPPAPWLQRWRTRTGDPAQTAVAMNRANPVYIPRNHKVEEALNAAIEGDLAPFQRMWDVVTSPFDERPEFTEFAGPAPADSAPYQTFCGT
ncbi:MAG: YdiU family protein [Myxococcota bacterium]